jgi:ammonium transporter, Amt family
MKRLIFLDITAAPSWLNAGDNAWQLTSATLVGLMSVPGLAIMYAGLVKRKWAINSALMVLYAFAMTLIVWTLFAYNMGFGNPVTFNGGNLLNGILGIPGPVLLPGSEQNQAAIPLLVGLMPAMHFPQSTLVYFQFVFAAITIIILGGALLGRLSFKAWMLFVPLWVTLVYTPGAFSLWAGGWLAQLGAVDYSGGYVIHVAAGISGVVAAAVIGPRLARDRENGSPSNLIMAIAGGGILWLGWSGFNGGDPYFANADAAAAVLNTHLCTATALVVWMMMDVFFTGKATVTGMISGMVAGLVAITPAAGYVNGFGALVIGIVVGIVPWFTMNRIVPAIQAMRGVDDTLGVMHTHLVPGAIGGLLTGLLADGGMIVYTATGKDVPVSVTGLLYGNPRLLLVQALALLFILLYDGIATFVVIKLVGLVVPLRMPETELEVGDQAVHGDVAFDLLPVGGEA